MPIFQRRSLVGLENLEIIILPRGNPGVPKAHLGISPEKKQTVVCLSPDSGNVIFHIKFFSVPFSEVLNLLHLQAARLMNTE